MALYALKAGGILSAEISHAVENIFPNRCIFKKELFFLSIRIPIIVIMFISPLKPWKFDARYYIK